MKHISALFTLLALLCFSSCQSNEPSGTPVQNVVLDLDLDQKLFLSEIADSIEVIPLEHTDESSIKLVWRVIPYKGRYYIMNGYTDSNVLDFDKQGKFVYKIDKRGQGPGEYISLNDIAIDPKCEELNLLTALNGVFRFDLDGGFIDRITGYGNATYMAVDSLGNMYLIRDCNESNPNRLIFMTKDSISYEDRVTKNDFLRFKHYTFGTEIIADGGNVYYSRPYCDTIFNVVNGIMNPILYIDYNGKNLPVKDIFKEGRSLKALDEEKDRYKDCFRTDVFRFSDNFLYVSAMDGNGNNIMTLHSFKTNKNLSGHRLVDDVFFPNNTSVLKGFNIPWTVEDGWLLWFVRPSWLLRGYNTYKKNVSPEKWEAFCKRHPKLVEVCSQLDEESNPVLFRIKVKDF